MGKEEHVMYRESAAEGFWVKAIVKGPFEELPIETCIEAINAQAAVEAAMALLADEGFRVLWIGASNGFEYVIRRVDNA